MNNSLCYVPRALDLGIRLPGWPNCFGAFPQVAVSAVDLLRGPSHLRVPRPHQALSPDPLQARSNVSPEVSHRMTESSLSRTSDGALTRTAVPQQLPLRLPRFASTSCSMPHGQFALTEHATCDCFISRPASWSHHGRPGLQALIHAPTTVSTTEGYHGAVFARSSKLLQCSGP